MTDDELARAIGKLLLLHRRQRRMTQEDVRRRGGPTGPTQQAIEEGRLGLWAQLQAYARAVKVPLVDVLRDVLAGTPGPLLSADDLEIQQLLVALPPALKHLVLLLTREIVRGSKGQ